MTLYISLGLLFSTVWTLDNELATGVIAAKYFRFYLAMGILTVPVVIGVMAGLSKDIHFTYIDGLLFIFTCIALYPYIFRLQTCDTKYILLVLLVVLYFYYRVVMSISPNVRTIIQVLIMLTALVESIQGLMQLYGYISSQHTVFLLTGAFFNPGPFAGYLSIVAPLALYYLLVDNLIWTCKFNKLNLLVYFRYILSVLTLTGIILILPAAMSRAAWIAFIVGCIFLTGSYLRTIYNIKKIALKKRGWAITAGIGIVIMIALTGIWLYYLKKDSADGRRLIWKNTITAIMNHPEGVGLGHFSNSYGESQANYFSSGKASDQEKLIAGNVEYAFNEYLEIGLEAGIAGLIVFLSIVGSALFIGIKSGRYDTVGVLIALLIFAAMSYPFSVLPFLIVFVFLLADIASCESLDIYAFNKTNKITSYIILLFSIPTVAFCLSNRYPTYQAYKDWNRLKILFFMNNHKQIVDDYKKLNPYLFDRIEFLFEYGQTLSKAGQFSESNKILMKGIELSCDPMFYNIMGKNCQYILRGTEPRSSDYNKLVRQAENYYMKASLLVPNRLYPFYLLTKLYAETGNTRKAIVYAEIVLKKEPKVESTAIDEMKQEMREFIKENK
jgi:tetratricopeptide (TPR) repeat protein